MQNKAKASSSSSNTSNKTKATELIHFSFIYRHVSLNKYITSKEFRHCFSVNKSNYEKTYTYFVKNIYFNTAPEPTGTLKSLAKKENESKIGVPLNFAKVNLKLNNNSNNNNNYNNNNHNSSGNGQTAKLPHSSSINSNQNQLQKKQKKFIVLGGYKDLVQGLIKRGWIQNKDPKSVDFDYIWTLRTVDINFTLLKKEQIAGHFMKNGAITRKSGLSKNIRNLLYRGINPDDFFPRCYDLSNKTELTDFIEDFKVTKAMSTLRIVMSSNKDNKDTIPDEINEEMVKISIGILERKMPIFLGEYNANGDSEIRLVSDKEWNIISQEDNKGYNAYVDHFKRFDEIGFPQINIRSNSQLPKKLLALTNSNASGTPTTHSSNTNNSNNANTNTNNTGLITINKIKNHNSNTNLINHLQTINTRSSQRMTLKRDIAKYIPIIQSLLEKVKHIPQYELNGEKNIWIMKPSCLSRGRGIVCTNKLNGILASIKESNQFIVQKYIENPMIILNRKFDIRQWILVTNINPLTIWIWEYPYLRFGAEDYSIDNFANLYAHLTNNSIGKYSDHFHDKKIEGNMWELHHFEDYLKSAYHKNVWPELKEKIIKIIVTSFESARHEMKQRANSHELFGYDLMLDVNLNVYLIEVNSSPAVDYSTKVTEKLVKMMSEDILKVVIDSNCPTEKEKVIGNWKLIYTGVEIDSSFTPNK